MSPWVAPLVGAATAAIAVPGLLARLRALHHERANFEGKVLANSGGVALLPSLVALLLSGVPSAGGVIAATAGFALLGLADDLWGDRSIGGLRGHLGALAHGRLTTGAVKALGGSVLAIVVASGQRWPPAPPLGLWATGVLTRAALIALTANAINLLDLRPLRALKAFAVPGLLLFAGAATARSAGADTVALGALLGAGVVYAPFEARRRVMLGDAGANLLGAALGLAAGRLPLAAQIAWIAALAALHAVAERRSISAWIDAHPSIAAVDAWGWRRVDTQRGPRA